METTEAEMTRGAELQQAVLRELTWDARVEETDIGVAVSDGVITLTGTVSSWAKRLAAQQAAHRVRGVLDVANDIEVKIPGSSGRTDTEIAAAVRDALEWDVFVPDQQIKSTVTNGWVTLEGEVDNWTQSDDAKRAIRNLSGVRGVTSKIQVKPPKVAAAKVREAIERALERQAEREANRVELKIQDGAVTMSGVVHSWAEREAAIGAAKGTPGVRTVESHIRIEPYAV